MYKFLSKPQKIDEKKISPSVTHQPLYKNSDSSLKFNSHTNKRDLKLVSKSIPLEQLKISVDGVQKVKETFDYLHEKDLAERSSYMRINTSKDSNGHEFVVLRVASSPQTVETKSGKLTKVKLDAGENTQIIYFLLKFSQAEECGVQEGKLIKIILITDKENNLNYKIQKTKGQHVMIPKVRPDILSIVGDYQPLQKSIPLISSQHSDEGEINPIPPLSTECQVFIQTLTLEFQKFQEETNRNANAENKPQHLWFVEVKVLQKMNTIVMRNGRKILKFNVVDQKGMQIECICYDETHDTFVDVIEEDKYFKITMAEITSANRNHTQVKNDFRLIMKENLTKIQPITSFSSPSQSPTDPALISFNLVPLKDIIQDSKSNLNPEDFNNNQKQQQKYVDVIAKVVTKVPKFEEIKFQYNGNTLQGRMQIQVIDKNNDQMQVFVWGENAKKADEERIRQGDIVILQNGRVQTNSKTGVQSLHCSVNSKIFVNPKGEDLVDKKALLDASNINIQS